MPRLVTLGADPELPITQQNNSRTLGTKFIPVCGLMGGDKGKPIMQGEEGGWLEDGVMLELNPTPSTSPVKLSRNVATLCAKAQIVLAKTKKAYVVTPVGYYKTDEIAKFPQAMQFGCAPDLNAYDRGNPRDCPMDDALKNLGNNVRFAGGHIHFGIEDWPRELPKFIAVRFLDLLVGFPFKRVRRAILAADNSRDQYYGLPGLYRETSYGLEYRTPCNSWVQECNGDTPSLLARARLVAELFADFENTREQLVSLYNAVNWDAFYAAFSTNANFNPYELFNSSVELADRNRLRIGNFLLSLVDHRANLLANGKRFANEYDPLNSKEAPASGRDRIKMHWDEEMRYTAAYFRASFPEHVQEQGIDGREGPEWEHYWHKMGGRIIDFDEGVIFVEFKDDSQFDMLPELPVNALRAEDMVHVVDEGAPLNQLVMDEIVRNQGVRMEQNERNMMLDVMIEQLEQQARRNNG